MTTLKAAAGRFSDEQASLDLDGEWSGEWIAWDGMPPLERGMFVARVQGRSMEPDIPDGAYGLFRPPRAGSRQGRTLLVRHAGVAYPHTGGCYTVKVYESQKRGGAEAEWEHTRITLKPRNPEYQPVILEPEDEDEVRVIAEFVAVVG